LAILVPLTGLSVVLAAPAQADPFVLTVTVTDALGDPVPDAAVAVRSFGSGTGGQTGQDGVAQVPVGAGTYRVEVSKDGYSSTYFGGADPAYVVVDGDGQASVDGDPVEDNDLGVVELESTTLHQVGGRVLDAGAPVRDVTVEAFRSGDESGPVDTATTDPSGSYLLTLPIGLYSLHYTDAGGTFLPTTYPGEVAVASDGSVTADGHATGCSGLCDVTLSRAPVGSAVAGRVVDALGDPVEGVDVSLAPTGSGGSISATTGPDGRYSVLVAPGTYQVQLARTGFVTTRYGGQMTPSAVTVAEDGTLSVSPAEVLADNHLSDVTLASTPYAVNGRVVDADGAGLAGMRVRALPHGSTDPAEAVDSTTSGPDGAYGLDLPVGRWDVSFVDDDATAPAYSSTSLAEPLVVAQGGALRVGGLPVPGVPDVSMSVPPFVTATLTAGVRDLTYAPVDGLTVSAVPAGGGAAASTTTGADGVLGDHGRFRLVLPPGAYQLTIDGGDDWEDLPIGWLSVASNGAMSLDGRPLQNTNLGTLYVYGATRHPLSGSVTDGTHGLSGVTVTAYEVDPEDPGVALQATAGTTTSASDGSWTLADAQGLPVGYYVVRFTAPSYDTTWFGGTAPTFLEVDQGGAVRSGTTEFPTATLPATALSATATTPTTPSAPTVVTAPVLSGSRVVGRTVRTTLGTWSIPLGGETVRVRWFLDGRPADRWSSGAQHQRFTVPASARGRQLTYTVTVAGVSNRPDATWTSRAYAVPRAASRTAALAHARWVRVDVRAAGVAVPTGRLVLREHGRVVGVARLRADERGVEWLRLAVPAGRHRVTVAYEGSRAVAPSRTTVEVIAPR
jgi:hypothetical protein